MTEKEKGEGDTSETVIFREDGNTFLNRAELDSYREQKVMLAWADGAYA